ncbi:hypothetical protein [Pseudonocardia sp. TRM90224]|uniref:hypothetical protein n=1 Tax=Pseudonocardia sp. TRM90224 TaxID=2812678 RepID=UPI001E3D012F|nr:hypothetical protein [Pseudonocardia sp. TRM90224]
MTTEVPAPSPLAAALQQATAILESLTPSQLEDLATGRGRLEFRPARSARRPVAKPPIPAGVDVAAAVAEINRLSTPADVADFLIRNDSLFTVPVLKEIAKALGPTVAGTGRNKAEIRRDIVAGTAGFRVRSAAMSGGAWSK